MGLPGGADENDVHIFIGDQVAVARVSCRRIAPGLLHPADSILRAVSVNIANSDYIHIRELAQHIFQQTNSPAAHAYKAKFQVLHVYSSFPKKLRVSSASRRICCRSSSRDSNFVSGRRKR